jgi:predicted ester cyclase
MREDWLMASRADEVIRAWFEQLWNQKREETIDRLLAPQAEVHGLPTPDGQPIRGPEGFKAFYRAFRDTFPDIRVTVQRTVTEGNMVTAQCHVTGRHTGNALARASGAAIEFSGMVIVRVEDGRIVEGWNSFDFLRLYQQIGVLPQLRT